MDEPQPVPLGIVKDLLEAELGVRENKHRCRDCGHFQPLPKESEDSEAEEQEAPEETPATDGEEQGESEDAEAPEPPKGPPCDSCGSHNLDLIEQIQYEHRLALDHVRHLTRVTRAQAEGIMQVVGGLEHVDDFYAAKIADILPTHPNDVRAIFARERFTLGQDEIAAIIAAVQEHTEA